MCGTYIPPRVPKALKSRTNIIGGLIAAVGALAAFLSGADWSAFFTPEAAAVAGATVVLVRALVGWRQAQLNK